MIIACLIVFGVRQTEETTQPENVIVNDLPQKKAAKKKPATQPDRLTQILTALFGQNASRVRSIFATSNSYAGLFATHSEKWESTTVEYKEERASEAYWKGVWRL